MRQVQRDISLRTCLYIIGTTEEKNGTQSDTDIRAQVEICIY
jgi:hypothetical protein